MVNIVCPPYYGLHRHITVLYTDAKVKQLATFSWCLTSWSKSGYIRNSVYVFAVICRIPSNWLLAFGNSFVFFTQTRQRVFWLIRRDYGSWSRLLWQYLMKKERVFHIDRSYPGELNLQNNKSRYEIRLWAYKSGVLICLSWERLLLLVHYLSFQAYTAAAAITATMAFSQMLRIDSFTSVLLLFR